jgi:hypothetical protein
MVRAAPDDFRLALEPTGYADASKIAAMVAKSGMFKVKSPEDAMIRIMTGRALGLPMFASLKGIFSFDGTVGIESKLKVALALSRPDCEYIRCTERSATRATYVAKRRGQPEFPLTFTVEEAKAAGLLDYDTPAKTAAAAWTRWRADMLMARASGKIVDIVFPEAALGLPSREELEDEAAITTTGVDTTHETPAPVQAAPVRDFAAECAALKQRILDMKTAEEKHVVRTAIKAFITDAGEPYASEIGNFYNMTTGAKPKASAPPAKGQADFPGDDLAGRM